MECKMVRGDRRGKEEGVKKDNEREFYLKICETGALQPTQLHTPLSIPLPHAPHSTLKKNIKKLNDAFKYSEIKLGLDDFGFIKKNLINKPLT